MRDSGGVQMVNLDQMERNQDRAAKMGYGNVPL